MEQSDLLKDIEKEGLPGEAEYGREDDQVEKEQSSPNQPVGLHIPSKIILFLVLALVLSLVSMIRFPGLIGEYKVFKTAESRIQNGETSDAIYELYELVEKYPGSTSLVMKCIDLSMQNGFYHIAGYVYDSYLVGMSLSDSEFAKVDKYATRLSQYYSTYEAIEAFSNMDLPDDEMFMEKFQAGLIELLKDNTYDHAYVYYYLSRSQEDSEKAINYMLSCYDLDTEIFDARVQLGIMHRRLGDFKKAKQLAEEALQKDKKDFAALRSMAILGMLEGDLEGGETYAKKAYDSFSDGFCVRETYLIALTMNNRNAEAEEIYKELRESGEILQDDTLQLLNGTITLEDYYMERE